MKWFFWTLLICILFFIVTSFAWNVRLGLESSFLVAFASLLLYMSKKPTAYFIEWLIFTIIITVCLLLSLHLGSKIPTRTVPLNELWLSVPHTLSISGLIAWYFTKKRK